ncbi:MAG: CcoQ/FixQ family Cbb3-type cytochrome c oxidase assembly chaperone [Rhizobiales bacterium]|nr:CcoQ/FixQ family Cbb3-type cytochrome c oxidase assembly chaperone [Hyphomicrobiales bacterium]MBI3673197.1 CcoQ/FixQ family Cbb3-type cytochrome c oxidase assembly chaperone [Hyphomicrobiales bacterium]
MTYNLLREFADSWGLVVMAAFFVAAAAFAFRPGSRTFYDKAARIPFENPED